MHQFLEQLLIGVQLGSMYALIALGYTMVYGVLKLINFAHGEVYMLGAYIALFASYLLGFSPAATIGQNSNPVVAAATIAVIGIALLVLGAISFFAALKVEKIPDLVKGLGALFV